MSTSIKDLINTIADNTPEVYDAGIEAGKDAENQAIWDDIQNYGKTTLYNDIFKYIKIIQYTLYYITIRYIFKCGIVMIFIQRDGSETRKLSYDNNVCLACGICADSCPTSSLALGDVLGIARGQIDGNKLAIDEDTCVICGLCASACPFGALDFEINGESLADKQILMYDIGNVQAVETLAKLYEETQNFIRVGSLLSQALPGEPS